MERNDAANEKEVKWKRQRRVSGSRWAVSGQLHNPSTYTWGNSSQYLLNRWIDVSKDLCRCCQELKADCWVTWSTVLPPPNFFGEWQISECMRSSQHKIITYLDCPSLGFDSSSTGDTARRPLWPARHYTVHSCLISASIVFEHMAFSLQSRRRSSCYINIFFFFLICNSNGQYRTYTMNYRNFPDNEHYTVFW